MTEHVPTSQIERFVASALPDQELTAVGNHLGECPSCHHSLAKALQRQRGGEGIEFTLAPAFWFRRDHLDYEQLAGLAEERLDANERDVIDIHLSTCVTCREGLRTFVAFRKQIEPELRVRYGPKVQERTTQGFPLWNPLRLFNRKAAYVAAVILIGVGLLMVALYWRRSTGNFEARETPSSQNNSAVASPTPENQMARQLPPPPPAPPEELPQRLPAPGLFPKNRQTARPPENVGDVAILNDGRGTVTVDKAGNVFGLDDISPEIRRDIAESLNAENIKPPETVTELAGAPITLRGPGQGPKFKLRSPARTVIFSDRPSFQWDALPGATNYQVSVGDLNGHEVARSAQLGSDQTSWTLPSPLKRGGIYVWEVEALVDGKKVFSPGTSETQMKFKILSDKGARELEQLKKRNSHLALAVFYAREAMLTESEHEFQMLILDNPNSNVLRNLLAQIQSWRQTSR